ncbi:hypothetical protein CsSME_00035540 [Camellia sinensis var. sinensis]
MTAQIDDIDSMVKVAMDSKTREVVRLIVGVLYTENEAYREKKHKVYDHALR